MKPLQKPRALGRGSRIALVAPSSPFSEAFLRRGIRFLEGHGFCVCHEPRVKKATRDFLAGSDRQRAKELMDRFEDPGVDALFAVRGGYGAQRLLGLLDPERIARNPKLFLGYSDATVLIQFFVNRCGLACLHGPLATEMGTLSGLTGRFLLRALTESAPLGIYPLRDVRWIRKGRASGPLTGGNLTVLCAGLGTPWEAATEGCVLFLEDSGEKPYRIDRMLVQLRQAGKLSGVAAIVFGDVLTARDRVSPSLDGEAVFQVLYDNTRDLGVPVLCGLPAGHGPENLTLPMGVRAEVGGRGGTFALLEAALAPREAPA